MSKKKLILRYNLQYQTLMSWVPGPHVGTRFDPDPFINRKLNYAPKPVYE